jgi:hypothetical protein
MTHDSDFVIDDAVPVPQRRPYNCIYPWAELSVGQSFFVPASGRDNARAALATSACAYGKRHGKKFSLRNVDGGVRVWRVK